jgi:hypothetical protein
MGQEALVESQVADAIELVKKLDSDGVAPTLAVWHFYDDAAEWRLILAGPFFDPLLPAKEPIACRKIAEALAQTSPSSLFLGGHPKPAIDGHLKTGHRR